MATGNGQTITSPRVVRELLFWPLANFTLKLVRPGFGPAAELPTSSPACWRHGGRRSRLSSANVIRGNRRAASASGRGPWPHSLACEPLGARNRGLCQRHRRTSRGDSAPARQECRQAAPDFHFACGSENDVTSAGCVMPAGAITCRKSRRVCGVAATAVAPRLRAAGLRARGVIPRCRVLRLPIHESPQSAAAKAFYHDATPGKSRRAEFRTRSVIRVGKSSDRTPLQ
jgi:hypothetical protein